jgi:hypothetical protein
MIQFKRGKTATWRRQSKPLADGQPGFDKETSKIKIGNGKDLWDDLPDASGLSLDEILDSEENAKKKAEAVKALGIFGKLFEKLTDKSRPVFTYGTEAPDEDTKGRVYLQYFNSEQPTTDYVVESAPNGIWHYRKWKSGRAECWGTFSLTTEIKNSFDGKNIYHNTTAMTAQAYPFKFSGVPSEVATVQSPGNFVWLASTTENTEENSGIYRLVSPDIYANADYKITIQVEGFWKSL